MEPHDTPTSAQPLASDARYAPTVPHAIASTGETASNLRASESAPHSGSPGERFGAYTLMERIGEGGFGEVWLAEQSEPVRRTVALKIIKPGMDSSAVIARFEAERQVLALMSHPNIAKVFDAGTTPASRGGVDSGGTGSRPYFVMEYIRGLPITAYCDRERLTIRERLALFTQVCEAVQHAHTKGIIHRDIKPANILVSLESDPPRPVVIDFGVAKALAGRLTEQAVFTQRGVLIGTPEYMSPEQAEMSEGEVDTRTDVYALGVVLYELLTGVVPFDPRTLRAAGQEAIQRIICTQDPPRPSTRLSTMGEQSAHVAQARNVRLAELTSLLRNELEWIPLRALRKARAERYRTAAEFADDIANYLARRPLIAGPETAMYKLRKLVRRNLGVVAAAGAISISLVSATGVSLWYAMREAAALEREQQALARETKQRREAEVAAERAAAIKTFLISTLQASDPVQQGDVDMLVSQALLRGVEHLRQGVDGERDPLGNQPAAKAEILSAAAAILDSNGDAQSALPIAEEALTIVQAIHPGDHSDVADRMNNLSSVVYSLGRISEAEQLCTQSLEMNQRLHPGDHANVAQALGNLAVVKQAKGDVAGAEPLYRQALEMNKRLHQGDHAEVASSLINVAYAQRHLGHPAEAEPLFVQALEMFRRLHKGDHPDTAKALNNLAADRCDLGRFAEAAPLFIQSLEMNQRLFKGDHPMVAISLNEVAFTLSEQGHPEEAEPYYTRALEMYQRLYHADHPNLAQALNNLAGNKESQHKSSEAEPLFAQALAMYRRLFKGDHPSIALGLTNLAVVRQAIGRAAEAEPLLLEALEMTRRLYKGDNMEVVGALTALARTRAAVGRRSEAFAIFDEAVAMLRRMYPDGSAALARVLWRSGSARMPDAGAALPFLEESVAIADKVLPADHAQLREYHESLARCREAMGK